MPLYVTISHEAFSSALFCLNVRCFRAAYVVGQSVVSSVCCKAILDQIASLDFTALEYWTFSTEIVHSALLLWPSWTIFDSWISSLSWESGLFFSNSASGIQECSTVAALSDWSA